MNENNYELEVSPFPKPMLDLIESEFGKCKIVEVDWDYRRTHFEIDGKGYYFRTWDITEEYIRWTLFEEDKEGNSNPIKNGVYSLTPYKD